MDGVPPNLHSCTRQQTAIIIIKRIPCGTCTYYYIPTDWLWCMRSACRDAPKCHSRNLHPPIYPIQCNHPNWRTDWLMLRRMAYLLIYRIAVLWVYGTWLLRPAIHCLIFAATFYFTLFRDSRSSKRRRNNILSIIRKRKLSLIWPTETMMMMLMEEKTPERVPDIGYTLYGQQVPVLRLLALYPGGYKRLYVAGNGC